ncbi:MAG: aminoacyl-tRNA hydrolase [Akkermansia sp.]|nr:aminoacyl-tRNA hydrolase [Akkermansia sp.]
MLPVKIIVGLGNPGREYAETRHNVGFMVLDLLAAHFGAEWKVDKARKAELAAGPGVLLVKPQTYMNSSGESVGPLMRYYKWEPEQVFVIYDDISFPVGALRLRAGGSAGGHNGMKSLIAHLGTEKFPRLRVGISAPGCKQMVSHVLGKFAPDERPLLQEALTRAAAATLMTLTQGFDAAANQFNVKKEKKKKEKPAPAENAEQSADTQAPEAASSASASEA